MSRAQMRTTAPTRAKTRALGTESPSRRARYMPGFWRDSRNSSEYGTVPATSPRRRDRRFSPGSLARCSGIPAILSWSRGGWWPPRRTPTCGRTYASRRRSGGCCGSRWRPWCRSPSPQRRGCGPSGAPARRRRRGAAPRRRGRWRSTTRALARGRRTPRGSRRSCRGREAAASRGAARAARAGIRRRRLWRPRTMRSTTCCSRRRSEATTPFTAIVRRSRHLSPNSVARW
mmetsp:Transcript_13414/g.38601  ORF Transcript_13414/g.38601 Transcript_13414/m.38601 type:complete len:231 (+) Transcript_13414:298-990(+)